MLEDIITLIKTLDSSAIYLSLFTIAYLENVVPPIPGDMPVAFVGTLVPHTDLSFAACVMWASAGSVLGFATMYGIGYWVSLRFHGEPNAKLNSRIARLVQRFFPAEHLPEIRTRFAKYGYGLILANRFLTGSRSIISISAGFSRLNPLLTHLCAAISAVSWNILLVFGGYLLGDNWETLGDYITTYGTLLTVVVFALIGFLIYRWVRKAKTVSHKTPLR
ncbi:MAG: DedA family protein [Chloroherpetonaceae bacterium]|nr:DedA family protein [Chloroherpetonaceae bacterium]MDW8020999.1 DedA family protein [Chloroherpetonaceae bacterium]MDW8465684.1 DedA family protein [Chloroherpetonaceae bacterium]